MQNIINKTQKPYRCQIYELTVPGVKSTSAAPFTSGIQDKEQHTHSCWLAGLGRQQQPYQQVLVP